MDRLVCQVCVSRAFLRKLGFVTEYGFDCAKVQRWSIFSIIAAERDTSALANLPASLCQHSQMQEVCVQTMPLGLLEPGSFSFRDVKCRARAAEIAVRELPCGAKGLRGLPPSVPATPRHAEPWGAGASARSIRRWVSVSWGHNVLNL